jgi:hypothetical protein
MGLARTVAVALGVVYLIVGVAGFIPPLVTGSPPPDMPSATGSLLGIFPINALHNVVHLVIGAALVYGSTATRSAIQVSRVVGIVYLIVGVLGIVAPDTFGLMPIGGTDILLHLGTALVLLYIGFMTPEGRSDLDSRARARSR